MSFQSIFYLTEFVQAKLRRICAQLVTGPVTESKMFSVLRAMPATFLIVDAYDVGPPAAIMFAEVQAEISGKPATASSSNSSSSSSSAGAGAGSSSSASAIATSSSSSAAAAASAAGGSKDAATASPYEPLPPEEDFELQDLAPTLNAS